MIVHGVAVVFDWTPQSRQMTKSRFVDNSKILHMSVSLTGCPLKPGAPIAPVGPRPPYWQIKTEIFNDEM